MTDFEQQAFEIESLEALRTFDIGVADSEGNIHYEQHRAHYNHTDDNGNLCLVTISATGQRLVSMMYNACVWTRLVEVGVSVQNRPRLVIH